MNEFAIKTKLEKIYSYYGYNHQINKLVEECAELVLAIAKGDEQNILEEMADVSVVIDQITYHFPMLRKEFEKTREEKIERTIERLKW